MSCSFDHFTNQYPISKTLRFALRPVGETQNNIKTHNILIEDKKLSEDYIVAKKIINQYHKYYIDDVFSSEMLVFDLEELEEYQTLYTSIKKSKKGDSTAKIKTLKTMQAVLRKKVSDYFLTDVRYKHLFKKELFEKIIPEWYETEIGKKYIQKEDSLKTEDIPNLIEGFKKMTTSFAGFHMNRKNMYSNKDQSTAIGYRVVHDNLSKFLDNIDIYEKIKGSIALSALEKELSGVKLDEVFSLEYFNQCLSQKGIEKYNLVLGGKAQEDDTKIKGLNEYLNLHAQKEKVQRLRMHPLFKQILSDRDSYSFVYDSLTKDQEVVQAISEYYSKISSSKDKTNQPKPSVFDQLASIVNLLKQTDLRQVHFKSTALNERSKLLFGEWDLIKRALKHYVETKIFPPKNNKPTEALIKKQEGWLKSSYFSVFEIQDAIKIYAETCPDVFENIQYDVKNTFVDLLKIKFSEKFSSAESDPLEILEERTFKNAEKWLEKQWKDIQQSSRTLKEDPTALKKFLDGLRCLFYLIEPLHTGDEILEKNTDFYSELDPLYANLHDIRRLYNKVRDYVTQRACNTKKYKLNFNNSTLLDGWDVNKEKDNTCTLLKKDDMYYLAILSTDHRKVFDNIDETALSSKNHYQKMRYKLINGAARMLFKVCFSKAGENIYSPSDTILNIKQNETYKDKIKDCHKLIDFFKECIKKHCDWHEFNFKFSATEKYENMNSFYKEFDDQAYKVKFTNISSEYIDKLVADDKLYLFQIYSKDFSLHSKGKPNLHTIFWKALFEEQNLNQHCVYQLNGQAEMFYRSKSLNYKKEIWEKGHHYDKLKNKFNYPIIKDKRYAQDQYLFHVPITLNYQAGESSKSFGFNREINLHLHDNNSDIRILSIDRGERHLAYYTLLDRNGNILKQGSFNSIKKTNYHGVLDKAEKKRDQARKSWHTIGNIKNLKEGYLSQMIHEICCLVIEHNAIVVLEDLNFGFKKGRFKIEKQIYQKLESTLINKLNYLVFKDKKDTEAGGKYKAYQLTKPFESFKSLGKQTGIIFYVPAYHTSKICPLTGFVNLIYPKYESIPQAQEYFKKFKEIKYNPSAKYFEFHYEDVNFVTSLEKLQSGKLWVVCSQGERLHNKRNDKGQWDTECYKPTEEIINLFEKAGINFKSGVNLINEISEHSSATLLKGLIYALRLTLQMRNSRTGTDEDYLISPIADKTGEFFDSRNADDNLPQNSDANGAYHIGLKGLWVLNKIKEWDTEEKIDLTLKNSEWYLFAQNK